MHRDIKLENILLDGHGNIKIGDFGVSKKIEHSREILFEQCGTPVYIAPEIVRDHGYRGPPTDVWSAGICLWAIICGNIPFTDQSHDEYRLDYPPGLTDEFKDLISKVLTVNPNKRLTA